MHATATVAASLQQYDVAHCRQSISIAASHLDVEALDLHGALLPHPPAAPDGLVLREEWREGG